MFSFLELSCSDKEDINLEDTSENKENIWIFLMAGQSNMAGRATIETQDLVTNARILSINSLNNWTIAKEPLHFYEEADKLDCGMSFARKLLENIPDSITIIMVPCAVGGSSVFQWLNDEEHRNVKLLSNFKQKVQLSKQKGIIKGILWHQGESNANDNDIPIYKNALLELFSVFREQVGNDDLPIILGEIGHFAEDDQELFDQINEIIHSMEDEKNCFWISSEGLTDRGDNLHFDSESQRKLGERYATKYLELVNY